MANYSCKKFSPTTWSLATNHNTSVTNGRTDRRQPCQQLNHY